MSIKNRILNLPISDGVKENLGGIYHNIHDPALKAYLNTVAFIRKNKWLIVQKNDDYNSISKFKSVDEIIPIHITAWHHGSAYFRIKCGDKYYFVKKETNINIARREVAFFNLIQSAEKEVKECFPQMYYYKIESEASYIISSYLEFSDNSSFNNMDCEDRNRVLYQLMRVLRWMRSNHICHNDLRMENICINGSNVRVFDFGYSCMYYDKDRFLSELSKEELIKLNQHNRIGSFISDDAFSMYYIMKRICPDLMSTNNELWMEINSYIGERVIEKRM